VILTNAPISLGQFFMYRENSRSLVAIKYVSEEKVVEPLLLTQESGVNPSVFVNKCVSCIAQITLDLLHDHLANF